MLYINTLHPIGPKNARSCWHAAPATPSRHGASPAAPASYIKPRYALTISAVKGNNAAAEKTPPAVAPSRRYASPQQQQQQQQQHPESKQSKPQSDTPWWLQQLQRRWDGLDGLQRGYTVLVAVLLLAALPRVLTLLVLMLERVVVGGLLATEELLVELIFKASALVGAVGVVGLLVAGVFVFARKATK